MGSMYRRRCRIAALAVAVVRFGALAAGGTLAAFGAVRAQGPGSPSWPMQVTTDTVEYCNQLAGEARRMQEGLAPRMAPGASPEVPMLTAEGRRLCAEGHVRPGIARLRRAITQLRGMMRADPGR
jgi:hypothetical protein